MAIYSLRLTPIGKTTQKRPHTAAAHIRYISRACAVSHSMAERMPEKTAAAMRWLRREEDQDRKNARVADKLVIALPRELTTQQRITLVWSFAERLTQGKASWFAAIHAKGKDRHNPHCHLLVRDRDVTSGKRVVMFSAGTKEIKQRSAKGQTRPTTLATIRQLWEDCANRALAQAGRSERIDRRSLREQGIARPAQIHEGPNIRAMHDRGFRPASKDRLIRARAIRKCGTPATRLLRYTEIDRGFTRVDYNRSLNRADTALQSQTSEARVTTMADDSTQQLAGLRQMFSDSKGALAATLGDVFVDRAAAADSLLSMAEEFGIDFVLESFDREPANIDDFRDGPDTSINKDAIAAHLDRLLDLQEEIDRLEIGGSDDGRRTLDIQGERFVIDAKAGVYYRETVPAERFALEPDIDREPESLAQQLARDHNVELAKPRPHQERSRDR